MSAYPLFLGNLWILGNLNKKKPKNYAPLSSPNTNFSYANGRLSIFLGNLWEFRLKKGLKLCIFSSPNTKIFWPVLRTLANASPKCAACSLRLSPENLPRRKWSNFVVQYNIGLVHDQVRIFLYFWWFILNVFWLIFKNFWSKSIDSGKKRTDFEF